MWERRRLCGCGCREHSAGCRPPPLTATALLHPPQVPQQALRRAALQRVRAEDEQQQQRAPGAELDNPDSEAARKKAEADRLRAAEKFITVGTGEAVCKSCGYEYKPKAGDPEYPVAPGTQFQVRGWADLSGC